MMMNVHKIILFVSRKQGKDQSFIHSTTKKYLKLVIGWVTVSGSALSIGLDS